LRNEVELKILEEAVKKGWCQVMHKLTEREFLVMERTIELWQEKTAMEIT